MYDNVIKDLRNLLQAYKATDNGNSHQAKILDSAVNAIEELSGLVDHYGGETGIKNLAEYASKYWDLLKNIHNWIPVARTLPKKENRTYWICTDTGYQCECRWTNNRFGIGESDEWGWSIFDIPQYHNVVAWMSLPDPYEPPKE